MGPTIVGLLLAFISSSVCWFSLCRASCWREQSASHRTAVLLGATLATSALALLPLVPRAFEATIAANVPLGTTPQANVFAAIYAGSFLLLHPVVAFLLSVFKHP